MVQRTTAIAMLLVASCVAETKPAPQDFHRQTIAWQKERAKNLATPEGWLTLEGLFWLKPGANTLGSAKSNDVVLPAPAPEKLGVIEVNGSALHFTPQPGT